MREERELERELDSGRERGEERGGGKEVGRRRRRRREERGRGLWACMKVYQRVVQGETPAGTMT